MADRLKVLFVCSRNQWRSPTAEAMYRDDSRLSVRPQYTREVLEALANCDGIGDWTLIPNVAPGNADVIAAIRDFKACECRLVVNERRLGLNRNTLAALKTSATSSATISERPSGIGRITGRRGWRPSSQTYVSILLTGVHRCSLAIFSRKITNIHARNAELNCVNP